MGIEKDINKLLDANVITQNIADDITSYYDLQKQKNPNRILVLFGCLGALLVGLGIILIIGHNWNDLERSTKTIFSFVPLVIGQLTCFFSLIKKEDSRAWKESSSIFLTLAIGASISLISQVYNIDGNVSSFLLTWSLLTLPIVYLLKAHGTGLIYLLMITIYAFGNFHSHHESTEYIYWALLLGIVPHYILLIKNDPEHNIIGFYNWFFALSTALTLFLLNIKNEEKQFLCYLILSISFLSLGLSKYYREGRKFKNAFLILGTFGTLFVLFFLSGKDMSDEIFQQTERYRVRNTTFIEVLPSLLLALTGIGLSFFTHKITRKTLIFTGTILSSFLLFYLGHHVHETYLLVNVLLFAGAIALIYASTKFDKLSWLNLGMSIISLLIFVRFLDTDWSYVVKGVAFVLLGIGFFIANFLFNKNMKKNEA